MERGMAKKKRILGTTKTARELSLSKLKENGKGGKGRGSSFG